MRVLHVSQPTVAGVANVVAGLVRDQVGRGWDVAVACPASGDLPESAGVAGARVYSWPCVRSPLRGLIGEQTVLAKIVSDFAPDVVHLHSAKAGLIGRMVLRGKLPTLYQPHAWSFHAAGRLRAIAKLWERLATRWTTVIVAVSQDEREEGSSAKIAARYVLAPNGVNPDDFGRVDRVTARLELGLGADPIVLCVGRLAVQKGQDLLLRAWPDILRDHPSAMLYLVGEGELRKQLESMDVERVRIVGTSHRVASWLSAADVVAVPSRWEAGSSLVLLEAMASGASVVGFQFEGASDVVQPGRGALVPIGDTPALAAAISQRLSDPELRKSEGRCAAEIVRHQYDAVVLSAVVGDSYLTLFSDAG